MLKKPLMGGLTRRDILRGVAAASSFPLAAAAADRPTVGIIGAGMAGVSLAWMLDGVCDVVLFESRDSIGGNVRSVPVAVDGYEFPVDLGAQYFHPSLYPTYVKLLESLSLYPSGVHTFPASITLFAPGEPRPRFVSPILPDRPALAPWNFAGIQAFNIAFQAAKQREQANASWALTLGEWLPTLGLSRDQWEGMILPWAASIFSSDIDEARRMSARSAMIFAAKTLPDQLTDPIVYYVLNDGMAKPLELMLGECSTVQLLTSAAVSRINRQSDGEFQVLCADGRSANVQQVVFASSGPPTLQLLQTLPQTWAQQALLRQIEFRPSQLKLHTDPLYATADPGYWSFLNSGIHSGLRGAYCEASMWMSGVVTSAPPSTTAKVWKSWVTHRAQQPAQVLAEASFQHLLPTPASLAASQALLRFQGEDRLWFAGGYLNSYDSQETALSSALGVARGLGFDTERMQVLG
jgi:predicted NAD/FAD-binding protein